MKIVLKKNNKKLLSKADTSLIGKKNSEMIEKEIVLAIQEHGLRQLLLATEQQIRKKNTTRHRVLIVSSWTMSALSMAAVFALCVVLVPMVQIMPSVSCSYTQSILYSEARSAKNEQDLQYQLTTAYNAVSKQHWKNANSIAKRLIHATKQQSTDSNYEEYIEIYDQALWLHTMCEMQLKHVLRAYMLLNRIAKSNSQYAEQAQKMLKELR